MKIRTFNASLVLDEDRGRHYMVDDFDGEPLDLLPPRLPNKFSEQLSNTIVVTNVSSSTLIEPVKPSFVPFFVQEAAREGSLFHKAVENAIYTVPVSRWDSYDDSNVAIVLSSLRKIIDRETDLTFDHIIPEFSLVSIVDDMYAFGGTPDYVLLFTDSQNRLHFVVADLKTTTEIKQEHMLQTQLYAYMLSAIFDAPVRNTYGIYSKFDGHVETWRPMDNIQDFITNRLDYIYNPITQDDTIDNLIKKYKLVSEQKRDLKTYMDFIDEDESQIINTVKTKLGVTSPEKPISLKFPLTENSEYFLTSYSREVLKKSIVDNFKNKINSGELQKENVYDYPLSKREGIKLYE